MDFIVATLVRLAAAAKLALALLGFTMLFNVISQDVFGGPYVDITFSRTGIAFGVMYLLTFVLEPA